MDKSYLNSRYNKPSILKLVKLRLGFLMLLCLFFVGNAFGQNVDATWGANANTPWYTVTNWAGGSYPGLQGAASSNTNTATFTSAFTGTAPGINMRTASLNLGAISIDNTRTTALNVGNSGSTAGSLRLYGATVNSVPNTILRNDGTGLFTVQATQTGTMGLVLSNATNNIVNISNTGGITISSIISGANKLTKTGAGSGILTLTGSNTYTGGTIITAGTLTLGSTTTLADAGLIMLNGGTLKTGATTGFSETVGTLDLEANSTIALGTGSHTLTFAASNGVSWNGSSTLNITGWTGATGRIFFGNSSSGLTSTQLAQISFGGILGAKLLSTGELVPNINIFYSRAIGNWNTNTTWSFTSGGNAVASGIFPTAGDVVNIENLHTITAIVDAACASITFTGGTQVLKVNPSITVTVSGAVTLKSFATATNTAATISGTGTLNAGSLNSGLSGIVSSAASTNTLILSISTLNVSGNYSIYNNDQSFGLAVKPTVNVSSSCSLTASSLALVQTGTGTAGSRIINFNVANGATVNLTGTGIPITVSSTVAMTSVHVSFAINSGSTFNYNGSAGAQTIPFTISNSNTGAGTTLSAIAINYGILNCNNTNASGATLGAAVIATNVTGNISVGNISTGSLLNTNNLAVTFGNSKTLTVASGSTLNSGTSLITFGTLGTANINGTFVNTNSTGAFLFGTTGNAYINGLFQTANTTGFSGLTTTAIRSTNTPKIIPGSSSTIEYNALVNQAVTTRNYVNLTLSGSGNKTIANNTVINSNLAISGTAKGLLSNGGTSTALTLSLGGVNQVTGSWGSPGSSANNKTDTWFVNPNTGIINVNSGCTTGTWLGTTSTDWDVASNWCGGIPTAATNVTIASTAPNQPVIGAAGGLCNNITISSGASLTITGSNTLAVSGNWINSGTFTANTSTVTYNGAAQIVAAVTYYHLILSGSGIKDITGLGTVNGNFTMSGNNTTTASTTVHLVIVGNLTVGAGNTFASTNNFNISAATITVNGTYLNGSTGTITGSMSVGSGGTYNHNINGGTIPKATWDLASTCLIKGTTTTMPVVGENQTFGNFTWDCAGQSKYPTAFNPTNMIILGDLTVANTNSSAAPDVNAPYDFSVSNGTSSQANVTIGGNLIVTGGVYRVCYNYTSTTSVGKDVKISGGILQMNSSDSGTNSGTINVAGNLSVTGGSLNLSRASVNSSGIINVNGNVSLTAGTVTETGVGTANAINFTGTSKQTFTSGATLSNNINFSVASNAIVDFGASEISSDSTGTFTLNAGATLITANTSGISVTRGTTGSVKVTGERTYSTTANYEFNGAGNQTIGNGLIGANNLTLSGSGTKTFSNNVIVASTLSIATGVVANLGTYPGHTACSLTFNGVYQAGGTWGSSGGTGYTNHNAYFGVTGNGILTVGARASNTTTTAAICETTTKTLAATPAGGTWTVFSGGGSISGTTYTPADVTSDTAVTIRYTVAANGSCAATTSDATFTVNTLPTVSFTVQPGATACSNTDVIYTTQASQTNYVWSLPGVLNTDYTITSGGTTLSNTVTLKWLTSGSKTVTVNYTNLSGCPASAATTSIASAVNPAPLGGTATATSATLCPGSSTTISLTGNTGSTIQWQQSVDGSTGWVIVTGGSGATTTTYTTPTLTVTTYYRAVITSGSCTANSATATVTVNTVTKTWNGTPWPIGSEPTTNDIVIISEDFNTSSHGDLNAGCLTINTGKTLTITPGNNVTIQNDLTVNANATLDVLDKGSLVMVDDLGIVTNTGTTYIRRSTTPFKRYDYVYWSTPVTATNIANTFQPIGWNTNYAYKYIPGSDWSFTSIMSPGEGCIIMVPTPTTTTSTSPGVDTSTVDFSGEVNNGNKIKITDVIPNSSYLLGNPYPSAIDADKFLDANADVLEGTLYFWTHNTAIQLASEIKNNTAGSGAYAFTSDDYATYNRTGGVATDGIGIRANSQLLNPSIPTGYIASGQGFFGSSLPELGSIKEIVYNNSMRLAGTLDSGKGVNEQFFKTSNTKSKIAGVFEKHRIWLDLKNSQGAFKQTLVGYITGATNDYDSRFDGESFDGNQFVDFYSLNQNKNFTIQGRALPFDENDTVPLGFKTTIEGSFTINIGQVDGLLINQAVYLEDKLTNTVSNLKNGDYTFTTAKGTFNDRFVLRYTYKTLGINDTDKADGILVFYSNNYKTLIIKNSVMDATVNSVALFNTMGQRIANFDIKDSGQTNLQIPIKNIASGIYIVKVKTTKGESSKKVIVN